MQTKQCDHFGVMAWNIRSLITSDETTVELKEREKFQIKWYHINAKTNTINNKVEYIILSQYMLLFDASEDISKIYKTKYKKGT